ncbi:MAG: LuxR C-terminal-related transcriptional regulator [Coriobacteriia bacterium]|nr:LuxR C-terminal-related transcriptional regulator [Coriobacteriia bacterium]
MTDAQASASRDSKLLDSLMVIGGFGLCRSWIVFCLFPLFGLEGGFAVNWTFLFFGALAAASIALLIRWCKERVSHIRHALFWIAGITLMLSALLILLSLALQLDKLLYCGFSIGGIGAGVLQVLWGERFAHFGVRFATLVTPLAAICTACLLMLAAGEALVGYSIFPLVSFALLVVVARRTGINVSLKTNKDQSMMPHEEAPLKTLDTSRVKLMFSIMMFSFLCRMHDAVLCHEPDPFAFFGSSALLSLLVVGGAVFFFGAWFKERFDPLITYRLSLPLMIAGFVAIALFFDTHAAHSILLINIGYGFFDLLVWIVFAKIAHSSGEQPLGVFGRGVAFMFIGMGTGLVCGEFISTSILSGSLQITVIALLSILTLVVIAFLVIPEGTMKQLLLTIHPQKKEHANESQLTPSAHGNGTAGRLEENCKLVAKAYRLTPRESEVLVLLAYGRTLSIIARDLFIAQGTARTHIENIYRKLSVHKHQELIDLVEDYQ